MFKRHLRYSFMISWKIWKYFSSFFEYHQMYIFVFSSKINSFFLRFFTFYFNIIYMLFFFSFQILNSTYFNIFLNCFYYLKLCLIYFKMVRYNFFKTLVFFWTIMIAESWISFIFIFYKNKDSKRMQGLNIFTFKFLMCFIVSLNQYLVAVFKCDKVLRCFVTRNIFVVSIHQLAVVI